MKRHNMHQQMYSPLNCILQTQNIQNQTLHALYLGDIHSFDQKQIMPNIKTVISCIKGFDISKKSKTKNPYSFQHYQFDVRDRKDQKITPYFQEAYTYIEQGRKIGNVLIHCFAGVSRSATIVISYIMKKMRMKYQEAKQLVKSKRGCICPNIGFEIQLIDYEKQLGLSKEMNQRVQISKQSVRKQQNKVKQRQNLVKQRQNVKKQGIIVKTKEQKKDYSLQNTKENSINLKAKLQYEISLLKNKWK